MMITKCHPSSQFLPFARKSSKHLLFFSLLLWALLITPGWVHAQRDAPPCGITTEYLVIDLTTTDKYITDGTVTGSGHLPSVPGNSTAYTIYIKGSHKLIFNASYHFAPGTQIIFDDYSDDSGIYGGFIVQAGKVLTLQSSSAYPTTVRGCGDMWESITVNSTGKLIIQPQCTIRDAYRAVTLESNAILTADEAIFKANYTCIRVQPVSPYIYAPVNTYLTGNTFSGADALIRSGGLLVGGVYFNYPHYGIDAFNAKNLNIDADGSPSYPNVFKDYGLSKYEGPTAGIRGIASIITVKNAKFSNIGVLDSQAGGTAGYGILMTNTNGHVTSVLTVKGRGKTSSPSTFDHVYYGIETENVNLNIRNSRFTNGNIHINLPAGTTLSLLNCDIIGNSFEDYQTYGIHAVGMLPTAHFNVNLNDFTLTSDDLDQDGYIAGGLFSAYGTPATGLRLVSNNFRNNITVASGFDPGTSYGFNISGGQSASVVSNNFTNNEGHAIGVHMMGTLLNTDNRNMYVGISSNDIGFEAIDAMKTSISCDTFNNLGTGAFFQGLANDGSAVVENHFGSHAIGLHLADLTQIGLQRFRRNTWLPATTGQEEGAAPI